MSRTATFLPDEYRTRRLYCSEVAAVLERRKSTLLTLYKHYTVTSEGGRPTFGLDQMMQFCKDAGVLTMSVSRKETTFAFIWSRLRVVDELLERCATGPLLRLLPHYQ